MKKTFVSIIIFALLISTLFIYQRREKHISGVVRSCITDEPIAGAQVTLSQRGWGFNDGLVWDKDYTSTTITDEEGRFSASWKVSNSTNIKVTKEGHLIAEQWESPRKDVLIKILPGKAEGLSNVTQYCTLLADCLKGTTINGVTQYENTCKSY